MKYDFGLRPGDTQTEYVVLWMETPGGIIHEYASPSNSMAYLKYCAMEDDNLFWLALLKRQVEYLSVEI